MQKNRTALLTALLGFAGGLVVGAVVASDSRAQVRDRLREGLRLGVRRLDYQMKNIEKQVRDLERLLQVSREQFAARLQRGEPAAEHPNWEVDDSDIARELRHLPRR